LRVACLVLDCIILEKRKEEHSDKAERAALGIEVAIVELANIYCAFENGRREDRDRHLVVTNTTPKAPYHGMKHHEFEKCQLRYRG